MDDLHARRPINGTAARALGKGVHYEARNNHMNNDFEVRPQTKPVPRGCKDLHGKVRGRLTVVGFYGKGRWVCRCTCGMFCIRRSRAINNPDNSQDRCFQCATILERKKHYHWCKTGRDLDARHL